MNTTVTDLIIGIGSPSLVAIGAAVGNWRAGKSRKHRREEEQRVREVREEQEEKARHLAEAQAERDRDLADMMNTMMELVWAVRGKDQTRWEPPRKGLIQIVKEHGENDERIQGNLLEATTALEHRVGDLEIRVARA